MKLNDYIALCQRPDVLTKSILEDTLVHVRNFDSEVAIRLHTILMGPPIIKPDEYVGDAYTDYFEITLTNQEKEVVINSLLEEESKASSDKSWLSSLIDTWKAMNE